MTIPEFDFHTGQVQQLADRLGVHPKELVWHGRARAWQGKFEFCLCPIDLEKTAAKFGFHCERDEVWGDGVFRRVS